MVGFIARYFWSIAIAGVLAVATGLYYTGYKHGYDAYKIMIERAELEAENEQEQKEREVISLNDVDLRKRYCHWVRDSKENCLQADIPIRE